jgi:hypothetical protein
MKITARHLTNGDPSDLGCQWLEISAVVGRLLGLLVHSFFSTTDFDWFSDSGSVGQ